MAEYGWEMSRGRSRRQGAPPPGAGRRRPALRRRMPPAGWRYDQEYEAGGERYEPWWGGGPGYTGGYGYEYRTHRESGGRRFGYRRGEPAWRSGRRRLRPTEGGRGMPEAGWMGDEAWSTFTGYDEEYMGTGYEREPGRSTRRFRPADYDERAFAGPEYAERYAPDIAYGHTPPDRWPGTGHDLDHLSEAERRMTDDEIREAVLTNLDEDGWIDPNRIDVDVADGVVTLTGEVEDFMEARYAWDDAWESAGVRGVVNNLTVRTDVPRDAMELPQTAGKQGERRGGRRRAG